MFKLILGFELGEIIMVTTDYRRNLHHPETLEPSINPHRDSNYLISVGKETLSARLIEGHPREIELVLSREDLLQIARLRYGIQEFKLPSNPHHTQGIPEYQRSYDTLGPILRTQIPEDWHAVLGAWLKQR